MGKFTKRKAKRLLEALDAGSGNVSYACEKEKITRPTFYNWVNDNPEFREAVEAIKEKGKDFVESKLMKLIADENVAAIIFYLKTQAKDRGYFEKQEHKITEDSVIDFTNG